MSGWHFPRTQLAEAYLKHLEAGLVGLAIFAERRKGKTEFLMEDLGPLAREADHRIAYINFWENRDDPVYCILRGVERSVKDQFGRKLGKWQKELSAKLGGLQVRLTQAAKPEATLASEALDLLLAPKDSTVLIMFDEVQQLAKQAEFADLVYTLRTFVDSHRKQVRTVFTGSSQNGLNQIFRRNNAAFYNSASIVDFPDMNEAFVGFALKRFQTLSRRKAGTVAEMMEVFEQYHRTPFYVVDILQTMLREGIYTVAEGVEYYTSHYDVNKTYDKVWKELKALDRLLLIKIAEGCSLYNSETTKALADALGIKTVSKHLIQSAVERLRGKELVNNPERGVWAFESKELEDYVLEKADAE